MSGQKQHWVDTPVGIIVLVGIGAWIYNWHSSSTTPRDVGTDLKPGQTFTLKSPTIFCSTVHGLTHISFALNDLAWHQAKPAVVDKAKADAIASGDCVRLMPGAELTVDPGDEGFLNVHRSSDPLQKHLTFEFGLQSALSEKADAIQVSEGTQDNDTDPEPATTDDALPAKCRPAYESVTLLMIKYNCQEWAQVTRTGHMAQARIGKQKDTLACIPPATDKIKDEMSHVAETAKRLGMAPMELWCTGAIGMFHDTPVHETWIKVLK